MDFQGLGKFLVLTGAVIIVIGLALMFYNKIPFLGKLPGDIVIKKENFTLYFPIVTSILLSLIISLIFFLINLFRK